MARGAFIAVVLSLAAAADAHAGSFRDRALSWAATRKLPVRKVTLGPAHRRVERIFIPVLPEDHDGFTEHFGEAAQGVVLRYNHVDPTGKGWGTNHFHLSLKPRDVYYWARNLGRPRHDLVARGLPYDGSDLNETHNSHAGGGHLFAISLEAPELAHLQGWLEARDTPGDTLYCVGDCMEWLANAELGPGMPLFHALGLHRAQKAQQMRAKLIHAGNERVEVVGVVARTVQEFLDMPEPELTGPLPSVGIDDAVR